MEIGADYAEIDVQRSRDEVLVVTHDSDFSRQAGMARKVWELTADEIREIPLAKDAADLFRPSTDARRVLRTARGRIPTEHIELKYYGDHQPRLAERTVAAVRDAGMEDQVIVQSLH